MDIAKRVPVPMFAVPSMSGMEPDACPNTNAHVAICVVLVSTAAVVDVGAPVKLGAELLKTALLMMPQVSVRDGAEMSAPLIVSVPVSVPPPVER